MTIWSNLLAHFCWPHGRVRCNVCPLLQCTLTKVSLMNGVLLWIAILEGLKCIHQRLILHLIRFEFGLKSERAKSNSQISPWSNSLSGLVHCLWQYKCYLTQILLCLSKRKKFTKTFCISQKTLAMTFSADGIDFAFLVQSLRLPPLTPTTVLFDGKSGKPMFHP